MGRMRTLDPRSIRDSCVPSGYCGFANAILRLRYRIRFSICEAAQPGIVDNDPARYPATLLREI